MTMKIRKKCFLLFLLVSALMAFPVSSMAEEGGWQGYFTLGGGVIGLDQNKSYKFGEYSGVTQDGFAIGDFDILYDGEDNFYLDFKGEDLGWESRGLTLETGWYGGAKFYFNYDQQSQYLSDNSATIYGNAGSDNLTLPANFTQGANSATVLANLNQQLQNIDLRLKRYSGTFAFSTPFKLSCYDFNFDVSYKREEKDGIKSIGGAAGISAVILPEPVDYSTDDLNVSLSYRGEKSQVHLSYYFSNFKNNKGSLSWYNPYRNATGRGAAYGTTSQLSLDPDNQYHRIGLSAALDLPYNTRLSMLAEYGMMDQDDAFLPYSVNPAAAITTPLPRSSANASIDTAHVTLKATSRPIPKLRLNAKYKFYDTSNNTPSDLFQYVQYDTASQGSASSFYALYNLPYEYTQNQAKFDAVYNLMQGTNLKLGYTFENMDRNYREYKVTNEHTFNASINSRPSPLLQGALSFSGGWRRGEGEYNPDTVYNSYHTQAYINTQNVRDRFDTHPLLRKYDIADRDRVRSEASLNLFPDEKIELGAHFVYGLDNFPDSVLGMKSSINRSITVDISMYPSESVTIFAYYTNELIKARQGGASFNNMGRPGTKATTAANETRFWGASHEDDVNTLGGGMNFSLDDEDRLVFTAHASYSRADSHIAVWAGSSLGTVTDLPVMKSYLANINLSANYKLTENWSIEPGYYYESYRSSDWATDGVDAASATVANLLTLSGSIPDYEAHVGMMAISYRFGK